MSQLVQPITLGPTGRPVKETIIENSARCLACGDVIKSEHRHDFKFCSCHTVAVDGGLEYVRRVWNGPYEDTSVFKREEMSNLEIAAHHDWRFF